MTATAIRTYGLGCPCRYCLMAGCICRRSKAGEVGGPVSDVGYLQEMKLDWNTVQDPMPVLRTVSQLESNLKDTVMLAGSESFVSTMRLQKDQPVPLKDEPVRNKAELDHLGSEPASLGAELVHKKE